MAHVAFCIAPFAGHVHPSLAVVRELASRGHRVSYATTAEFSATARAAGGHLVGYQTTMRIATDGRQPWTGPSRDSLVQAQRMLLRELEAVAPVLNRAFDDNAPDIVVCDPMTWAGRALAGRCQVPAVLSLTSMIGDSRWSLGPAASGSDPAHPALPVVFAATSAVLSRLRTGLSADRLYQPDDGVPMIAYFPRAFQVRGDEFGPNVWFVGPCLPSRPGEARPGMAPAAPADGRRYLVAGRIRAPGDRQPRHHRQPPARPI
jgi:demethyllactenocin mycarosyltransferase